MSRAKMQQQSNARNVPCIGYVVAHKRLQIHGVAERTCRHIVVDRNFRRLAKKNEKNKIKIIPRKRKNNKKKIEV